MKAVLTQFYEFLFWSNILSAEQAHEVAHFVEEFRSVWKHGLNVFEPLFCCPFLPWSVSDIFRGFEQLVPEHFHSHIGPHKMIELFIGLDHLNLGLSQQPAQVMHSGRFLLLVSINLGLELIEPKTEG